MNENSKVYIFQLLVNWCQFEKSRESWILPIWSFKSQVPKLPVLKSTTGFGQPMLAEPFQRRNEAIRWSWRTQVDLTLVVHLCLTRHSSQSTVPLGKIIITFFWIETQTSRPILRSFQKRRRRRAMLATSADPEYKWRFWSGFNLREYHHVLIFGSNVWFVRFQRGSKKVDFSP